MKKIIEIKQSIFTGHWLLTYKISKQYSRVEYFNTIEELRIYCEKHDIHC